MPPEQDLAGTWPQEMHPDPLVAGVGEDDFTRFLDLDDDFAHFEGLEHQNGQSALDTPMGRLGFAQGDAMAALPRHDHGQEMMPSLEMNMPSMQTPHMPQVYPNMQQNGEQQYQQFPMYQQMQQSHHYPVPLTPASAEMHGAKYAPPLDSHGQLIFDRRQASFTPLVSPAQTPLDNAFCMPEYIVADDFFSPLTSPAIEAQHHFASTNTTASPADLNNDSPTIIAPSSAGRRTRRKPPPPARNATHSVRQSPAMKPQSRRKQASLNALPLDKIGTMLQGSNPTARLQPGSAHTGNIVSSEDSVSPEPLSESLMRPPPVPSSKSPSSIMKSHSDDKNAPATPATLMRVPGSRPITSGISDQSAHAGTSDVMEDILLPDAIEELPTTHLPEINTRITRDDGQSTPTLSAKTPKLSADSTPRSAGLKAAGNSHENLNKAGRGGRAGKKRQSVSSAAISPALRPKISPSISPLVPASSSGIPGLSAETSALYLASKSNYQNILDGTHLPGVSYPETLAENLSSKRTSHKIAEQGRRNRINLALKEIESLLPQAILMSAKKEKGVSKEEKEEAEKGSAAAQGASKASTVEMAIVYIKSLQAELQVTREKLEAAEKTIAEGSSGSQTSEQSNA